MKKLILPLFAFAIVAATAHAQCPPVTATSGCSIGVFDNDACPTGTPPTLVWCPAGDLSTIRIRVIARGSSGLPCAGCDLTIRVVVEGEPTLTANQLWTCGFPAPGGTASFVVTTDAVGQAILDISGGGCGCLKVSYWVEASSCGGTLLCQGTENFCLKSPDMNGDGTINFFDTFQYLPQLTAGQGYCADFNCDGSVNFFDTFQYLPHLSGGHACPGSPVPIVPCGALCN